MNPINQLINPNQLNQSRGLFFKAISWMDLKRHIAVGFSLLLGKWFGKTKKILSQCFSKGFSQSFSQGICLFICVLPTVASAASIDDLTLVLSEDGTQYTITHCKDTATGDLDIPDLYQDKPITNIRFYAFSDVDLNNVHLPGQLKGIESSAFQGCKVKNINLPQGVTVLEGMVFSGCERLKSINIEGALSSIGEGSFRESGLVSISLPESLTSINTLAFAYCSKLYSMTFDGAAPNLGDGVFAKTGPITVLCKKEYLDSFLPWEKLPDANITVEVRDEASISGMRGMYRDMHRDAYRHGEGQPKGKKGIHKRKLFKFPNCCE